MSTQQDIYAARSENRPPMLKKENYVPWSSRLLRYAKIRPNGKLIYSSIINGPYVRRMNPEPCDAARAVPVPETFHEQTDDELTEAEINRWKLMIKQFRPFFSVFMKTSMLLLIVRILMRLRKSMQTAFDRLIAASSTIKEDQYTKLLEPIPEPHQVPQNDSNVISEVSSMEQGRGTIEQHPVNVEETRAYQESLFHNLVTEVKKVNLVNRKMKETNAELTTELARYKNHSGKQITALNEEISNLNKQLSKEKSTVSSLQEEKKRLKSDFKIREDELLDKQIQLENKIKELDNILVKTGQSIQTMHMLSPKPDSFYHTEQKMALGYQNPFYLKQAQQKQQSLYNGKVLLEKHDPPAVYDSEETLQLAQESRLKMKQLNKEIKPANYTKINHLSGVFVSQTAKSREELYFSNTSKTANVSKPISIPNEEFSDDTTPSVARKFLNEVKSTIVTLQRVVKQKMTLDIHNWSSSVHQEIHKIVKDEIFPIVNQVDARLQNFKIQFLKEATKFVRDFKSLAKEADESLAKHKALELEIERLLRAVVSQDIMSIVKNNSVVDTLNLQTKLERTKERFENCIIKKENEYAKLWNDWYKKCEECKYDKISYDKAYNDRNKSSHVCRILQKPY
ncbi:hypothetical protein Tco_0516872 [Tanacetum coccineum]